MMKQAKVDGRRGVCTLLVATLSAAVLFTASMAQARPTQPTAQDRQTAIMVYTLLEKLHLSQHGVDDEISERCLKNFLETLDPLKLYFLQADIDEFKANDDTLDDMFKRGDTLVAHEIFDRFLERVEQRITTALEMVDTHHDFTVDESMVREREARKYATTDGEAREFWRKRVKFDLLREVADDVGEEEAKAKLRRRYSGIRKRWNQTDNDELLELYLTSLSTGFDPHSTFMSADTLDTFDIMMRLKLDGIGASLRSEDGYTEVVDVVAGGAADQDGRLKEGDQILGVGQGTDGEIVDIVDMKLNDVVKMIRGDRGTVVRLEVKPAANPASREVYSIVRQEIKLKDSEARSLVVPYGNKPNGQPYQVGVINLPSFYMDMQARRNRDPNYKSTTRDVRRLLEDFNKKNVDAVVVDLRFNGGGVLKEVVDMTGLFIDKGPVALAKTPDGEGEVHSDTDPGVVWSGPLMVITNKYSASASEIFAGAIRDYNRGLVIGDDSTHGKGTVQNVYNLGELFRINRNLGALKLTIQQFYLPDGESTQIRGVPSDVILPSLTTHLDDGEAGLDYALAFDRVPKLKHDMYSMIDDTIVNELRVRSTARISASKEFQSDLKRFQKFDEQKERETITLNLEKYKAELKELDAEEEAKNTYEDANDSDRPIFDTEKSHYNREALSILLDYLDLLKDNRVAIVR